MAKHALLDQLMGDLDDDASVLVKRRRTVPMQEFVKGNANPDSAISNYTRVDLMHREDDFTVAPASIMDSNLTFNIPPPSPA
tara:strand:+ start:120 stop:365 length:246 start_codon:yes stop_codon:yes gene_type:complete